MRLKLPLLLVAVSVGTAAAQYSASVVGYVNKELVAGYTFLTNPLNTSSNWVSNLLQNPPDGSRVYVWDVTNQVYLPPAVYSAALKQWSHDYELPVGRGFVNYAPMLWTNTFVGEVLQGYVTNFVAGSNHWSLIGSKVPQAGSITTVLGFPRLDGANVSFFRTATQKFAPAFTCFDDHGWFDPKNKEGPGEPVAAVAEAFLVQNPGAETNWIRRFVVARPEAPPARATERAAPRTPTIKCEAQQITLMLPSDGAAYDIQHSRDGTSWQTVARKERGKTWSTRLPDGEFGYYQLALAQPEDKP